MKNYIKAFVFALFILIPASAVYAQYDYYTYQAYPSDASAYTSYSASGYSSLPPDYPPCYYNNYNCGYNGTISITDVSGPNSLTVGQSGTWRVTTNAPSNSNISVSVDWGDYNQYPVYMAASAYQVSQNNTFTHSYQNAGTYTITFTASDSSGRSNASSVTVQVGGGGGCGYYGCTQATFTATPTSGQAPLAVVFRSSAQGGGTYSVNYGDGTNGQMQPNCYTYYSCDSYVSSHTYAQAGTYTAQLIYEPSFYCPPGAMCPQMMPAPRVVGTVVITVSGGGGVGTGWCNWWDPYCFGTYDPNPYYNSYNYFNQYDYQNYYPGYDYYGTSGSYNYYW